MQSLSSAFEQQSNQDIRQLLSSGSFREQKLNAEQIDWLLRAPTEKIYAAIGVMHIYGVDEAFKIFSASFDKPILEWPTAIRAKINYTLNQMPPKINVIEGEFKCPNCKGFETVVVAKQIRAADEPATLFGRCMATGCGHNWRIG